MAATRHPPAQVISTPLDGHWRQPQISAHLPSLLLTTPPAKIPPPKSPSFLLDAAPTARILHQRLTDTTSPAPRAPPGYHPSELRPQFLHSPHSRRYRRTAAPIPTSGSAGPRGRPRAPPTSAQLFPTRAARIIPPLPRLFRVRRVLMTPRAPGSAPVTLVVEMSEEGEKRPPSPSRLRHFRFLPARAGSSNVVPQERLELARAPAPAAAAARRMSRPRPDMSERRTRSGGATKVSGERRALGGRGAEPCEGRRPWSVRKALPLPPEEARLPAPPPPPAPRRRPPPA